MKLFLHVGFHKTGTTSTQAVLRRNRALLISMGVVPMVGWRDLGPFARIARQCAVDDPEIRFMRRFRKSANQFAESLPNASAVLVSQETILGKMPGSYDRTGKFIKDYHSLSVPLLQEVLAAFQDVALKDLELVFLFSLRGRDGFIKSSYKHQIRNRRITDTLSTFASRFPADFTLESEVEIIATRLNLANVKTWTLENSRASFLGPADGLLDLAGVPRAEREKLVPVDPKRMGQTDDVDEEILSLNLQIEDDAQLELERRRILDSAGIPPD